jgi:hypothetical protein
MLDFLLVLGQIPGTDFQLSFWELVFGTLAICIGLQLWRRPALRRKYAQRFRLTAFYIYHFRSLHRLHH